VSWLVEELVGATRRLIAALVFVVLLFLALAVGVAALAGLGWLLWVVTEGGR
jgi:hypothetical protein